MQSCPVVMKETVATCMSGGVEADLILLQRDYKNERRLSRGAAVH